jgi:hypothetical protein
MEFLCLDLRELQVLYHRTIGSMHGITATMPTKSVYGGLSTRVWSIVHGQAEKGDNRPFSTGSARADPKWPTNARRHQQT